MKLIIASDIHGSALYCRELMEAWKREAADRMLILGDIIMVREMICRQSMPRKRSSLC